MFDTDERPPDTRVVATRTTLPQPSEPYRLIAPRGDEADEHSALRVYLQQVRERLWLIALCVAMSLAGATIYIVAATPLYEAQAQLLIEPERPNIVAFADVIDEQSSKTDYYQTQYQVLRSRMLARRTMDALKLWRRPEFAAPDGMMTQALRWVGLRSAEPLPRPDDRRGGDADEVRAIGRFLGALTIEPIRNSRLLNVRFRSPDPKLAASVVNTLVRAYIDRELDFKVDASRQARAWLDERIARQRQAVQKAEQALQAYRVRHQALPLEGRQDVVAQRLVDLNTAATRARTERLEKQAVVEQWQALARSGGAAGVLPGGIRSVAVEDARSDLAEVQQRQAAVARELGERHPDRLALDDMVARAEARLQAEVERVVESARTELAVAAEKETQLSAALNGQKHLALAQDQKGIEYRMQEREATSSRQMYEALLQRAQETAVAGELKPSNVRIVDLADVPLGVVSPRSQLVLAIASVAGTGAGLALVLLVGHLDDRLRSAQEIRRWLDVTYLGNIPTLPRRLLKRSEIVGDQAGADGFSEALRMVRTNLAFFYESGQPRVLVVTSTSRGEGKTVVSTNLALALAQARQRVLLVDGDMRRPRLHEIFGTTREVGLADVLADPSKAASALRETAQPGLTLLPAGTEGAQVADLLGFDPITHTLAAIDRDFDWVIFDSPPVDAATDACLLSHRVARVLFVVAGRRVRRHAARAAVDQLSAAGADFVGAVLTRMHSQPQDYAY